MRRKLLIGLVAAALVLAGFGGAVLPASAKPHNFLLTLADHTTVPYTGEPGTEPETVKVAGVPIAVVSAEDLGAAPPEEEPPAPAPAPAPEPEPQPEPEPKPKPKPEPKPEPGPKPDPKPVPPAEPSKPETTTPTQTEPPADATPPATSPSPAQTQAPSAPAAPQQKSTPKQPVAPKPQKQATGARATKPQVKDEGSPPKNANAKKDKAGEKAARDNSPAKQDDKAAAKKAAEPPPAHTAPPPATNPTFSLAQPGAAAVGVPNFFIDKFRIPPFLLPIYQAAGVQYGIRWEVLAAINEIETDYGRNLNISSAGAVGWMQFMPATWELYGTDANHDGARDPYNPVDAIFAAARYLSAAGGESDVRRAIFAYNHADWYVDSVLMRARLIGGLPTDLVGSLTGLTQGHFPVHAEARYAKDLDPAKATRRVKGGNAAIPVESETTRRGINIYAKAGSPVIAVQDGRIVKVGQNARLGTFIMLRDAYGNTYTYGKLKKLAHRYPVPKAQEADRRAPRSDLDPAKDPKPTAAASAGTQLPVKAGAKSAVHPTRPKVAKERLFANPYRPHAYKSGGEDQLLDGGGAIPGFSTFKSFFTEIYGLSRDEVELRELKVGSKVIAGTILGRIGRVDRTAPHTLFEIRPAGRGAPRVDPKPILDGWKLLESTAIYRAAGKNPFFGRDARNPSIGQVLLMSKESLTRRVLRSPNVRIYECGRRDIRAGAIDRRVLATLEFLAASGLKPTVTSLECGHGRLTTSGNVSEHTTGTAVDIAAVNGIPILGHQGPGSITDITIRRLLTLQGTMKPHQIISLMTFDGTDNTLAMADHNDHIHVGFRPEIGSRSKLGGQLDAVLQPRQWARLMRRLGQIDNPTVATAPSSSSLKVDRRTRTRTARSGD